VDTVQYVVTDGSIFTDLQQRDMTYSVSSPDRTGMVCQITSADARHGYELASDYITDPARDSVLVQTVLQALPGHHPELDHLQVYVRYDATIDNTGGGGSTNQGANNATVDPTTTALVSTDHTAPSGPFAARVAGLVASRPRPPSRRRLVPLS
jgi:glucoamylase